MPRIPLTWGPLLPFTLCCSRRLAVWFVVVEEEEQQPARKGRGRKAAHQQPTGELYIVGVSRLLRTAVVLEMARQTVCFAGLVATVLALASIWAAGVCHLLADLSVPARHLCPAAGQGDGIQGWDAHHRVCRWTNRRELPAVGRPGCPAALGVVLPLSLAPPACQNLAAGVLALWGTASLRACACTLRLRLCFVSSVLHAP